MLYVFIGLIVCGVILKVIVDPQILAPTGRKPSDQQKKGRALGVSRLDSTPPKRSHPIESFRNILNPKEQRDGQPRHGRNATPESASTSVPDPETALERASATRDSFIIDQGYASSEFAVSPDQPADVPQREASLREHLSRAKSNRDDPKSAALAVSLAFEHARLQLLHPDHGWKHFDGLNFLHSTWKRYPYISGLLTLTRAFRESFPEACEWSARISRLYERKNTQWNERKKYKRNKDKFFKAQSVADKRTAIFHIIRALNRQARLDSSRRSELVKWCLRDVDLYDDYLREFHEDDLLSADLLDGDHASRTRELAAISIEQVRSLENYRPPGQMESFDVLRAIYRAEGNAERMQWLEKVGQRIGHPDDAADASSRVHCEHDFAPISREIQVPLSGQRGKRIFLDSKGKPCDTERAFADYFRQCGWQVMRAEVSFWQAMFGLAFWDEIFAGMGAPTSARNVPHDLYRDGYFYRNRKSAIDDRYNMIQTANLPDYICRQIRREEGARTGLLYRNNEDLLKIAKSKIAQEFLHRVEPQMFAKVVYRIAQNPQVNRTGLPDYVIWNSRSWKMIEVKRPDENLRNSQSRWLSWMVAENIPVEIVRVRGVGT